ncbi:hypothetical protein ACIBKY_35615 [Nonomuraea sp. NPDC050394]|uniref:hypothetical protein n=1 Tax=Nonomuraea sp. NPDC050394 TaxID=3364363 RepID=UPI0037AD7BFE
MPTPDQIALADQFAAAEAEADMRLADFDGEETHLLPLSGTWLYEYVTAMEQAVREKTGRVCAHLGRSPAVMYTAVWMPTTLVCLTCTPVLALSDPQRIHCYRCDKRKWPLNEGIARAGNVLMSFLICDPCGHITGVITQKGVPA